ncbi:D-alanine--D-alanine ligase family protein [Pseudomonas putida]
MIKKTVAVLCGGVSAEHKVSLLSSRNVVRAIDRSRYDIVVIGIRESGEWDLLNASAYLIGDSDLDSVQLALGGVRVAVVPGGGPGQLLDLSSGLLLPKIDVVFPVLHGGAGENGALQGLLCCLGIPFVGASVLGSAICMDKEVTKRLLAAAGLPVVPYLLVTPDASITYDAAVQALGWPLFVKPACQGSSVGVQKVRNHGAYDLALAEAFRYDRKVLVELAIDGREIECAATGYRECVTSGCGEITPHADFYGYEAKYSVDSSAEIKVPAMLSLRVAEKIHRLTRIAWQVLECSIMLRLDYFVTLDGDVYINEANTLPGFTDISMFPKLWNEEGIDNKALVSRLLALAEERFVDENMRNHPRHG